MRRLWLTALLLALVGGAPAQAAEPKLTVPRAELAAALHCDPGVRHASRTPIMVVTGTGATGTELHALIKPMLDTLGAPVCWVDFPSFTLDDIQDNVQYLVYGLREMSRRAGRPVAVYGISQGGLLPRIALTYWPSLRARVTDVVSAAGSQHGTTLPLFGSCGSQPATCPGAIWQQRAGSKLLRALNRPGRDETPGRTAWTTVRSSNDEVVLPQTGSGASSILRGASNVLIQDVCPGRQTSHIGTVVDSVSVALLADAIAHKGPGRVARLPAGVCASPYAPGLDEATTGNLVAGALTIVVGRLSEVKQYAAEPPVRAWMRRAR